MPFWNRKSKPTAGDHPAASPAAPPTDTHDDFAAAQARLEKSPDFAAWARHRDLSAILAAPGGNQRIDVAEQLIAIAPAVKRAITAQQELSDRHLQSPGVPSAKKSSNPLARTRHLGYERMAIDAEQRKDFAKAIEWCEQAQAMGWAGDWTERIARCRKKLKSA